MAELMTIARPYAEAAFDLAKEKNSLGAWSETLSNLATVASDEAMVAMIKNPAYSDENKIDVFKSVMGEGLSAEAANLLSIMAENGRLITLPEVAETFNQLKAEEEKVVRATVYTARKLTQEQTKKLSAALNAKFDAEVEIEAVVDADLLSGIKIKVGDWAVDGTAISQLTKLGAAIAH